MKRVAIISLFLFSILNITGQVTQSIGLKANDNYSGINHKVFISDRNALDLTLDSNFNLDLVMVAFVENHHRF